MFNLTDAIAYIDHVVTDVDLSTGLSIVYNAETQVFTGTLHEVGARDPHVVVTNCPSVEAALVRLAAELRRQIEEA